MNAANMCNGGSVDPLCFSPVCLCCSDEDDELYEKLSGEHRRLECLMHLLAELKDSDLPGDFFLDLLKVNHKQARFLFKQPRPYSRFSKKKKKDFVFLSQGSSEYFSHME